MSVDETDNYSWRMTDPEQKCEDDPQSQSSGISLEELSASFGRLLGRSSPDDNTKRRLSAEPSEDPNRVSLAVDEEVTAPQAAEDPAKATPKDVVEGLLFVGHPENRPLCPADIAQVMRGVSEAEVVCLVDELNAQYRHEGRPYTIASESGGYRMQLTEQFLAVRDKFYGKVRQARLSQSAIDVLSVVAYNQPVTRAEVDEYRSKPSSAILNQLVRRQLIRLDRTPAGGKLIHFRTTDRFLRLLGIADVSDLPRSQEMDVAD